MIVKAAWLFLILIGGAAAGADEPIDWFSHRRHEAAKQTCASCHVGAEKGERAGFPKVSHCMLCHTAISRDAPLIRKLAALPKADSPFAAKFHKLPDMVVFSHARHAQAKIECATCHGAVNEQDRPKPLLAMKMAACMDCHKRRQATTDCSACHELGQ